MQLLLASQRKALIANNEVCSRTGETAEECVVKLFDPSGRYTFFVFDGEEDEADEQGNKDMRLFGYVVSPLGADCDEWGYTLLSELASIKGRFGLGIERDRHFAGVTSQALRDGNIPQ